VEGHLLQLINSPSPSPRLQAEVHELQAANQAVKKNKKYN